MTRIIVNITAPVIIREIETVLDSYPYHPYQQAFAIPDLRQELIAYVQSRVSNLFVTIEDGEPLGSIASEPADQRPDHRACIQAVVHEGIQIVFHRNEADVWHHIPQEPDPRLAPSSWFG